MRIGRKWLLALLGVLVVAVMSFAYRCELKLLYQRVSDLGHVSELKFNNRIAALGKTNEGLPTEYKEFLSSDCVCIHDTHIQFSSPSLVEEEFSRRLKGFFVVHQEERGSLEQKNAMIAHRIVAVRERDNSAMIVFKGRKGISVIESPSLFHALKYEATHIKYPPLTSELRAQQD